MTNTPFEPGTTVIQDIAGDYTIDVSHSRLGFSARHAMVTTVRGAFKDFTGTAHVDTANPADSKVELTIRADSIDTGVADRDAHLRSADFFDVETYPEITFASTSVDRVPDGWTITGDLTIKGATRPVTLEFESTGSARDPFGNLRIGFEARTAIDRHDFGVSWQDELPHDGVVVSNEIELVLDLEAIKLVDLEATGAISYYRED